MKAAISEEVKDLIWRLRELHKKKNGKPATYYQLEQIYGISRQTLKNWAERPNEEYQQYCEFIERARRDLGIKESTAYRLAIKEPLKKPKDTAEIDPTDKVD